MQPGTQAARGVGEEDRSYTQPMHHIHAARDLLVKMAFIHMKAAALKHDRRIAAEAFDDTACAPGRSGFAQAGYLRKVTRSRHAVQKGNEVESGARHKPNG